MLVWQKKAAILQAVRKKEDNGNNHPPLPSFQSIPQYLEVPPNIEAKRINSYFYSLLLCQSKPLLLKDDSRLLIIFRLLAIRLQ
jgi:hypothetical protein